MTPQKLLSYFLKDYIRYFARFGTIAQFKKRERYPWRSVTFSKVRR